MKSFSGITRFGLCCSLVSLIAIQSAVGGVMSFGDIRYWVGSGSNRAALVIDWEGNPEQSPLVWGYRWSGQASAEMMVQSIIQADPRLYARIGDPGPFGIPLYGLGYDRDRDGFGLNDGTLFGAGGLAVTAPSDTALSLDSADSYNEGWNFGFWAYYWGNGNPYNGGSWTEAQTGLSDRILSNGTWDGFRFAPGFAGSAPESAMAARPPRSLNEAASAYSTSLVPEPNSIGALILVSLLAWRGSSQKLDRSPFANSRRS